MIKTVTAEGMRAAESYAIQRIGIPALLMMERAALGLARCVAEAGGASCLAAFRCGGGHTGGDGLAAARLHINGGGRAHVVLLAAPGALPDAARLNYTILLNMGVTVHTSPEGAPEPDVVVDALLGTGLRDAPRGAYAEAIAWINARRKPVIAVDVPSGVDAATGRAYGVCVEAAHTVTFGFMKQGLALFPGRGLSGAVSVCDIGLPALPAIDASIDGAGIIEDGDVAALLPPRRTDAHKGDFGHAGIIAGSPGMAGAAALCARGALRGGAGLVTVACPSPSVLPIVQARACEAMAVPLEGLNIADFIKGKAAVAIGPGLGRGAEAASTLKTVLESSGCPVVCDADALNIMAEGGKEAGGCAPPNPAPKGPYHFGNPMPRTPAHPAMGEAEIFHRDYVPVAECLSDGAISRCSTSPASLVLTPHPGEMARLMGVTVAAVLDDPLGIARACARALSAVVLLKGATTVVTRPDGHALLSLAGTPGMATGGCGDVLTGLIAALLCQGLSPFDAAAAGAHLHGRAGERAAQRRGERGMTAWDVAQCL